MQVVVDRNSGVFDKNTADQLNISFSGINKKIENYKTLPLDYKEDLQLLNGNSFRAGNFVCIRDSFVVNNKLETFTKVGNVSIKMPYEVWTSAVSENNDILTVRIGNNDDETDNAIWAVGHLSHYPQTMYLSTDFILPTG